MKTLITITTILLSTTTLANFKLDTHNWNVGAEQLLNDHWLLLPDLVSLFTKEDFYVYQDIDIFGYTPNPATDKIMPTSVGD